MDGENRQGRVEKEGVEGRGGLSHLAPSHKILGLSLDDDNDYYPAYSTNCKRLTLSMYNSVVRSSSSSSS